MALNKPSSSIKKKPLHIKTKSDNDIKLDTLKKMNVTVSSPMTSFIMDYNKITNKELKDIDIIDKIKEDFENIDDVLDEIEKQSLCNSRLRDHCNLLREHQEELLHTVKIERDNIKEFVCNSINYWTSSEEGKKRRKFTRNNSNSSSSSSSVNNTIYPSSNNNEQLPVFNDIKTNINNIPVSNKNTAITTETTNVYLTSIY